MIDGLASPACGGSVPRRSHVSRYFLKQKGLLQPHTAISYAPDVWQWSSLTLGNVMPARVGFTATDRVDDSGVREESMKNRYGFGPGLRPTESQSLSDSLNEREDRRESYLEEENQMEEEALSHDGRGKTGAGASSSGAHPRSDFTNKDEMMLRTARFDRTWTVRPGQTPREHRFASSLRKNLYGNWGNQQRSKAPQWAFFVPALEDDYLRDGQDRAKPGEAVTCLLCWCGIRLGLHPRFPVEGEYAATKDDEDVEGWLPQDLLDVLGEATKHKRYTFHYKAGCSANSLKQHLDRNHPEEFEFLKSVFPRGPAYLTGPGSKRPAPEPHQPLLHRENPSPETGFPSATAVPALLKRPAVGQPAAASLDDRVTIEQEFRGAGLAGPSRLADLAQLAGYSARRPGISGGSGLFPEPAVAEGLRRLASEQASARSPTFGSKAATTQALKNGMIMSVYTEEQARIAEQAGAVAVVAHYTPARRDSSPALSHSTYRMMDPRLIKAIKNAVSIPVIARVRAGHFVEGQIMEAAGADFIDESEYLPRADALHYIHKHNFTVPFICGASDLRGALRRISEGAVMLHLQGDSEDGLMTKAISQCRALHGAVKTLQTMDEAEIYQFADDIGVPFDLVHQTRSMGRLPVVVFGSGGIESPADVAMMMQMGMDGVFVDCAFFHEDGDFACRARGLAEAVQHFDMPALLVKAASTETWYPPQF